MNLQSAMLVLLRSCEPRMPYRYRGHIDALSFISSTSSIKRLALSSRNNINNRRRFHVTYNTSEGSRSRSRHLLDAPYFPIYYNDVYEVDLPSGHRFPMWKYRQVREAVQAKVGGLMTDDTESSVHCGKHIMENPACIFSHS